jgi:hypothetical protein
MYLFFKYYKKLYIGLVFLLILQNSCTNKDKNIYIDFNEFIKTVDINSYLIISEYIEYNSKWTIIKFENNIRVKSVKEWTMLSAFDIPDESKRIKLFDVKARTHAKSLEIAIEEKLEYDNKKYWIKIITDEDKIGWIVGYGVEIIK